MKTLLTKKEKEALVYLKEVLKFGDKIFHDHLFEVDKGNYKRQFIAFHFGAIHNYSEAIYTLCADSRPHAATVILRSIFEGFLNMIYFVNTNSNLKIAKYAIEDAEDRLKVLKQFKNFVDKYPKWEDKYSMTDIANLDRLIIITENNLNALKRGNKLYKSTKIKRKLRDKAEAYDRKINKDGEWEYNYLLFYKFSSSYAHLSLSGMENFVHEGVENSIFDIGRAKNVMSVLATTFGFYVTMLNYVRNRGYLPKEIKLTKFNKQLKDIQKSK